MVFDKQYYENIWGSVHRHNYADGIADRLIRQYSKCRILDIGTGCGYLVKVLRDRGCDAWGLEISDYALENSCAKGYVLKGTVVDIPFKDDSFDVIHSQGLWEYVKEEDVDRAVSEVYRVGRYQEHNYDAEEQWNPEEHHKITIKPRAWWVEKLKGPKILIGCPIHSTKEYSFDRWIDCINKIDYPNKEVLVVDNSEGLDFFLKWKARVPMVHIDVDQISYQKRTEAGYEYLRQYFVNGDFVYWLNVDSDVLVPPETLRELLKYDADWVCNYVIDRQGRNHLLGSDECSLFNKKIMSTPFEGCPEHINPDGHWWMKVEPLNYKIIEMRGYLRCEHV